MTRNTPTVYYVIPVICVQHYFWSDLSFSNTPYRLLAYDFDSRRFTGVVHFRCLFCFVLRWIQKWLQKHQELYKKWDPAGHTDTWRASSWSFHCRNETVPSFIGDIFGAKIFTVNQKPPPCWTIENAPGFLRAHTIYSAICPCTWFSEVCDPP